MEKKGIVKQYAVITAGTFLVAVGIYFFMMPGNVIVGSVSGFSIVLSHFIPIPVSLITLVINAILLVIGFLFIGKEFGLKTIYAALFLPFLLGIFETIFPNNPSLTNDVLLDTICYLLIVSTGAAILFSINASSGGLDVVAKIMNKYLYVEMGKALTLGGMILAFSAILVYDTKALILGLLATYANGVIVDHFIDGFNRRKRVCILSTEYEKVQDYIVNQLSRGVTLYQVVGGFKNDTRTEIITILTRSEYGQLLNHLHSIDPKAFVTVSTVNQVIGHWNVRNRSRKTLTNKAFKDKISIVYRRKR